MSTNVAPQRVLPTLNTDGSRRWLRPILATGHWWRRRRRVGWVLMVLFVALPWLRVGGKPALLLDIGRREFTLFGATLYATDTLLLMLFLIAVFLGVFSVTALFGRVWCGWACPQTVYLEFLFRPLERFFEGTVRQQRMLDAQSFPLRRIAKWTTYLVLSTVLANVFLAYFVGTERLALWVVHSPAAHPQGFGVVVVTSLLMFLDFAWFREQMCVVACPYARLQAVLLDQRSVVVAYDVDRGEPRGKLRKTLDLSLARQGDCVDCNACVTTCPTGIDIRQGLQLECVTCAQCIDACDTVMDKIRKPRGLIRFSAQAPPHERTLPGQPPRLWRKRVVLYPVALAVVVGLLVAAALARTDMELTLLRGIGAPFAVQADGEVHNQLRIKIVNHAHAPRQFRVVLQRAAGLSLVAPENPMVVAPGEAREQSLFVVGSAAAIGGSRTVAVTVTSSAGDSQTQQFRILGPKIGPRGRP